MKTALVGSLPRKRKRKRKQHFLPSFHICTVHFWAYLNMLGEWEKFPPLFRLIRLEIAHLPSNPNPAQLCMSFGFAPLLPHYFLPLFFVTTAVVCSPSSSSSSFSGKTASGCKREGGGDTKLLFGGEINIDIKIYLFLIASTKSFLK